MSRYFSHINTAKNIIAQYKGEMPMAAWLKNFFSKEKKYGSRDRRSIASLCYNYFRTGNALITLPVEERMLAGTFLSASQTIDLLAEQKPGWADKMSLPLQEKLEFLKIDPVNIFSFNRFLGEQVEVAGFNKSFLVQPKLFIRIRPTRHSVVHKNLAAAGQAFEVINDNCLAFENGTKLDNLLELNKDYVVQDYNSQQVFNLLSFLYNAPGSLNVWDCCAASGGKAIMATDVLKNIQLTVSDVRASILNNLNHRLKQAAVKNYHSFIADLTLPNNVTSRFANKPFDLVICDAPCSGSGTWSRTPEQLAFFKSEEICRYSEMQKKIAGNVIASIRKNGLLLYITCSVFKEENEQVITYLQERFPVKLVRQELYKGYDLQSDSMFAALLQVKE